MSLEAFLIREYQIVQISSVPSPLPLLGGDIIPLPKGEFNLTICLRMVHAVRIMVDIKPLHEFWPEGANKHRVSVSDDAFGAALSVPEIISE